MRPQSTKVPPALRAIGGVLAGVLVGGLVIAGVQALSPYKPPTGLQPYETQKFSEWTASLPTEAYLYVLASYLAGTFVGGWLTGFITRSTPFQVAWLTGFILMVFAVGNFLAYTHPEWLTYSACIGMMLMAILGGWIARRT